MGCKEYTGGVAWLLAFVFAFITFTALWLILSAYNSPWHILPLIFAAITGTALLLALFFIGFIALLAWALGNGIVQ